MTFNPEKPPSHLSQESRKIWYQLNQEYEFDTHALIILQTALESYDTMQSARKQIEEEGLTILMPAGYLKPHPSLQILKEARGGFLQSWRMLNLGIELPGTQVGRPPEIGG